MQPPQIVAPKALSLDADGNVTYAKDPDTLHTPASTIKMMTGWVARQHTQDMAQLVEMLPEDMTTGSLAHLRVGDVVSLEALMYGMMLPSGNECARAIGRVVGQIILDTKGGTGTPLQRFVQEMNTTAQEWGWDGAVFGSSAGYPDTTSRLTARHAADLIRRHDAHDPWFVQVMGTYKYVAAISGLDPRNRTFTHSINPDGAVKLPEFVAGKTGTINSVMTSNVAVLWDHPEDGTRHTTVIYGSWPADQRYVDLRAVMDYVIAGPDPDPDPDPTGPTLRFTDGRAVALRRTDGTPVMT